MMDADGIPIFAGSGSPRLTARICAYLQTPRGRCETLRFSEGNLFVRILDNVRGRNVYVVQSIAFTANDNFMELLFLIDALKRASADSVTAVIPYFSYAKGDKKDEPRVSIRARVCADAIEVAGADRVVTLDLHAPQIQGFFRVPVDNLYALPVLCDHIRAMELVNPVVVSPDIGFAKRARDFARHLGTSIAIAEKERVGHDERPAVLDIIGDVAGKTALIVDDFTITGRTLIQVAERVRELGAIDAYAVVSHGVLAPGAVQRLTASSITRLVMTDSVENQPDALSDKIDVVSVAPLFGEAIKRIHDRESISAMFPP